MPPLKFYYDLMSQPSRAVYIFLKINNIPFVDHQVALRKGEHLTEEYTKINPFQLVPVIDDDGFILTESASILCYLRDSLRLPEHWYPSDLKRRARVDAYLSWHQFNVRLNAAMVFRTKIIEPRLKNVPVNAEKLARFSSELDKTICQIEKVFLKERLYLCGDDISLADLMAICELLQPYATGLDVGEGHPVLAAWMERVKGRLAPHFEDAHKYIYAVRDRMGDSAVKL